MGSSSQTPYSVFVLIRSCTLLVAPIASRHTWRYEEGLVGFFMYTIVDSYERAMSRCC